MKTYKITFKTRGLWPFSKTIEVLSHAIIKEAGIYEFLLPNKELIHIPVHRVKWVKFSSKYITVLEQIEKKKQEDK